MVRKWRVNFKILKIVFGLERLKYTKIPSKVLYLNADGEEFEDVVYTDLYWKVEERILCRGAIQNTQKFMVGDVSYNCKISCLYKTQMYLGIAVCFEYHNTTDSLGASRYILYLYSVAFEIRD